MSEEKHTEAPVINGLVLAGGKSTRMGTSKEAIRWHGKEQRYWAADLLATFCDQVFISCRADQAEQADPAYRMLPDSFPDWGPLGGILSAFRFRKDAAWLVVACDLPLLDQESLDFLVRSRNPDKVATVYESPAGGFPEPLVTVWEPASYPLLLEFVRSGKRSPRKFLMENDIVIVKPENPLALMNVNTPEEAEAIREILKRNPKTK
ncbi:NTP transferase domain-containing protein [Chryseobacterium gregarium]|uniref:NTP transferase domain-containing protein n=1 Tax=Chryseobacterium gregarium TaxID=456299 RepID=UPI000419E1C0|nr:NTP transferase domain-containing protein [Chryseobacterium gregarium]